MPKPQTPFTETELLLAVTTDDFPRITELLDGMHRGELERLADHAAELERLCRRAASRLSSWSLPI